MSIDNADTRTQPPEQADERETVEAFLDFQRQSIVYKASGLSDTDAARALLPSITTVSGMVRHLADVERDWFRTVMAGEVNVPARWTDDDPDGEWRVSAADSLDDILADYIRACEESRVVSARYSFDDLCAGRDGAMSLRWITMHMIEETARHLGQLDILRELLDGATGE